MALSGNKLFGPGRFFGINNVTDPTPARFGVTQDMSVDFKRQIKELFGDKQFAEAVGAGEMSVTGKVTMGKLNPRIWADLLFNVAGATGQTLEADKEAGTVGSGPETVTVTNSANFTTDLGVTYADGTPLTLVAATPSTGQYSVSAGVYTFNASDSGKSVLISYLYTDSSNGETITMDNQVQGPTGDFTSVMVFPYGTEQNVLTLNSCLLSDTGIATKLGDFVKPTFSFQASVDTSGKLGTFAFAQAA